MLKNVLLMKLMEQEAKDVNGAQQRIEHITKAYEKIGGKLLDFYTVTGEYDYVAVGDIPTEEAGMTLVLRLRALGYVKVTTCREYTQQEFTAMTAKFP
jgi:uncharacterized protein with GYD domain